MSKRSDAAGSGQPGLFDLADGPAAQDPAPAPRRSPPEAADPDASARAFATDPRQNVVLEASAGTGKTSVLVQRYLNLLGAGVDPVNILAMTFTRKAAAEMRERIITALRTAALTSEEARVRWLQLRDRIGDIAISTIDAFCYGLLREFPLEAGLDPGFRVAEEAESARLVDDALDQALRVCRHIARADPYVALVLARLSPARLRDSLAHLLDRRLVVRSALDRYLRGAPVDLDLDRVRQRVASGLGTALGSVPGGLGAFLADGPLAHPRFAMLASDLRLLERGAIDDAAALGAVVDEVRAYFLTQEGKPRSRVQGYRREDAVSPEAWRRHSQALVGVAPAVHRALAAAARDLNVVLARGIGRVFTVTLEQYRRTLAEHDVVDFPELIERAVDLLRQMDEFSQSRFRLESRYHHVLVDEFQDTSRRQWELVALLVRSWGEGFGLVHDAPLLPSLFIVGDRKQSIYRFRDARVTLLDEAAETIDALRPGGAARRYISRSFRALPGLLAFVNDVCGEVAQGSDRPDRFTYGPHDRFPIDIETEARGPESLGIQGDSRPLLSAAHLVRDTPLGLVVARDGDTVAALVAGEIARLLASGTVRDRATGVPRAVAPGDIAILFRSRESHREFEAALEARHIPAYVYKGLGFYDSDEIKDLVALIRFLAAPESDLRAAAFLRSRLVRLSDAGVRALGPALAASLAGGDQPASLDTLNDEDRRVMIQARTSVAGWLALVDRWRPAEVIDHVLAVSSYADELAGPRAGQARENVKKLRALVRRIDNRGYATMARLAAHIDRLSVGDESNAVLEAVDAVNLMTVHASKGLEFPVVFVVNVGRGVAQRRPAVRVRTDATSEDSWVAVDTFQSEADAVEPVVEREETKRLLYVALTRARDRLYLSTVLKEVTSRAGTGSLGSVLPGSLMELFARGLSATDGDHLTWQGPARLHDVVVARPDAAAEVVPPAEGSGVFSQDHEQRLPTPPDTAPRWPRVAATALLADDPPASTRDTTPGEPVPAQVERLMRPDERPEAADLAALFARFATNPSLVDALGSGVSEFEVPFSICDRDRGVVIRGAIDCLVRRPDGSLVVIELKTGRPRPRDREQLEFYVAAARSLHPGAVATGLLVYA